MKHTFGLGLIIGLACGSVFSDTSISDRVCMPLMELQKYVVLKDGTEPTYDNVYRNNHDEGINVDIHSAKVLFSSKGKSDSGTSWPSFKKPKDKFDSGTSWPSFKKPRDKFDSGTGWPSLVKPEDQFDSRKGWAGFKSRLLRKVFITKQTLV